MKKLTAVVFTLLMVLSAFSQTRYNVIPYPNSLDPMEGSFSFKNKITVSYDKEYLSEIQLFSEIFYSQFFVILAPTSAGGNIIIKKNKNLPGNTYKLNIDKNRINIETNSSSSCFYALQTLHQLITLKGDGSYEIPACSISDYPNFSWRAFMLDESRHFKGKEIVKKMLDQMALLKMNVFHWHLTDDQGWRIEIKKYPLLTEVGAWRDSTQAKYAPKDSTRVYNAYPHGGYYSQKDIIEIVEYASKRHIMVVPEIEMPGHASAAVAAYPWLSASGESIKVTGNFGIFKTTYNVADEKVFTFLTDVLSEVMSLFPSKIIHIGGDEVKYDEWITNDKVQELMKREGFKSPADVQVFFVNRISEFIQDKGFRMMGWNEIMGKNVHEWSTAENSQQTLAKTSIVHFWKGEPALLKEALEQGYDVVNSNHWDTYLDYTYTRIPLEKAYNFSPVPEGLDSKYVTHILGSGCQMWSEYIPKVSDLYRQVFPRIAAYAEVGWTSKENKDYNRFLKSLNVLKRYWDSQGITYYSDYLN